jgi:uncharacterized protein (DUF2126 family)
VTAELATVEPTARRRRRAGPLPKAATPSALERALAAHDATLAARGLEIWIGNEPTFTDHRSQAAEWLSGALGDDKVRRARDLARALARQSPGCAVLRSVGRQYAGETAPRWSFGVYARRDGVPLWDGPPDPLLAEGECGGTAAAPAPPDDEALQRELGAALARRGFAVRAFRGQDDWRVAFARQGGGAPPELAADARLLRPSVHDCPIPEHGAVDELAREGLFLIIGRLLGADRVLHLDLPGVKEVGLFRELLAAVSESARACGLAVLVLRGHQPPTDSSVSLTTVTPDPAVIELNMAPHPGALPFLHANRAAFAAATRIGLAPLRLHYNGAVADSGGGGQMTLGGLTPARSPFFVEPALLSRLVRYVVRHPALSYLFAHDHVGPCGQSVRPDERGSDSFAELRLALALLAASGTRDPAALWGALAPLLTDATGNSHRADINVEKLWNPRLLGRGQLGLVELRGLRMQQTAERAAALAALWRALIARLMVGGDPGELIDWGATLHDRFALPFYLEADLREVLADLEAHRLGLAPAVVMELAADPGRHWITVDVEGVNLTMRRALEFWPLVGDAAAQQGSSRLVDASTSRVELALRSPEGQAHWTVSVAGVELPMRSERDAAGPVRVFGLRYRSFTPAQGLHPALAPQLPVRLVLAEAATARAWEIALHEWRPDGQAYAGLPRDLAEASERRAGRCLVHRLGGGPSEARPPRRAPPPPGALTPYTFDLRYL